MRIVMSSTPAAALVGILLAAPTFADHGSIRIRVVDRDGAPVPEVAVYAKPVGTPLHADTGGTTADAGIDARQHGTGTPTIDQHDLSFSPHISIIETGTAVAFPNDDDVRHHVYSFSSAKRLNMTIDSHSIHADKPVFDTPGVVTLGCNIHDNMLAYVLVVDTPYFAKTDATGTATLATLEAGDFEINIWTPRLSASDLPAPEMVRLSADATLEVDFRFENKLFPPHEHSETSLHWSDY
jgi:plastocyanin